MELLLANTAADKLAERLRLARELGHKEALLLFTKHDKKNKDIIAKIKEHAPIVVASGLLIKDQNHAKLGKQYDAIVAPCRREFFESRTVTHILDPENGSRSDFIHHRNSGLNQVVLNLAKGNVKRKPKTILTSFAQLLTKQPAVILGRMAQNARWCMKYKVTYAIVSGGSTRWEQRSAEDLQALHRILLER